MKKTIILLFTLAVSLINAKWEKVNDYNISITGDVLTHNGSVYLVGDAEGSLVIYKSTDEGDTWTDITSNDIEDASGFYSFSEKLYAAWIETIYVSEDDGSSWSVLSTISLEGALLGFASDDNVFYVYSNSNTVYKSTDEGITWVSAIVDQTTGVSILDFAAVGNVMVAIASNVGGYVSTDGGQTFVLNQPQTALTGVHAYNNELYGFTFGDGVYKYDFQNNTWVKKSIGLPTDGSLVIPKKMVTAGNTLFVSYSQVIGGSGVAMSSDFGESWIVLSSEGMPTQNGNSNITLTNSFLFEFYYGVFDPENTGTYRTPVSVTSVEKDEQNVDKNYHLSQNYPNPFNPSTTIKFSLPQSGNTSLKIYDVVGNEVAELVNEKLSAGSYSVTFNASQTSNSLSSGVYFYRLQTDNFVQTKKFILIK